VINSKRAVVIASDRVVAEKLTWILREIETNRKSMAIDEWAKLIDEVGLSRMGWKEKEARVGETISRKKRQVDP
jgi:hypothetical protein